MNLNELHLLEDSSWRVLISAALAVVLALVVHRVGAAVIWRITRNLPISSAVARRSWRPTRFLLPLIALQAVWQAAPDALPLISQVRHGNALLLLATLTWLALRAIDGVAQGVIGQHSVDVEDNLNARRIHTQTRLLARTAGFMVLVAGLSLMLMTFPGARQVGTSLLASAGLAGLAAGFAAKPVLGNLIAGLQIAISQPIRLDDVVIVEGEWGRVEEISGTYVVIKIWDERRMVVPLQYFIEKPFQNWTRATSSLIGSVFVWVDYSLPVEELRAEVQRICEDIPHLWDGRVCVLQVADTNAKAMQLRVLLSSADSSRSWDARCHMRERLIAFIAKQYPQSLPQLRTEISSRNVRPEIDVHETPVDIPRQPPV